MFRGWCLSINEMRRHHLQLGTQQRRTQAESKEGDSFSFSPVRGIQGIFSLCFICNWFFSFIKPGDYWEEKVCSVWLSRGGHNYSRHQVPVCLQVCWFWWQDFTTWFLSCVSSFPNSVAMLFVLCCANRRAAQAKKHILRSYSWL